MMEEPVWFWQLRMWFWLQWCRVKWRTLNVEPCYVCSTPTETWRLRPWITNDRVEHKACLFCCEVRDALREAQHTFYVLPPPP